MKASGTVGLGASSPQALLPSDKDVIGPTCDFSKIGNETYDPVVVVGDPNQVVTAHEIGHALGLPHGNGIDDECNGVWDEDPWFCDQGEAAADRNANNVNLMTWSEATNHTVVTDIQRGLVRTFALHSVPTLGSWGTGCKAATPPTPPDDTTVLPEPPPSDGGIVVGGDGGGRPPTVTTSGCACQVDGVTNAPPAWALVLLSLIVARRRRQR
jgi:MYXO-CTERM domain-containing protein